MRRLGGFFLIVVLVLLVAGDFAARRVAEDQLRDRLSRSVRQAQGTDADIDSLPFLGRLLLSGTVSEVTLSVHGVVAHRLRFRTISTRLHDLQVDRERLLSGDVVVSGLGRGRATAEVTDRDLSQLLGAAVRVSPGTVTISARGRVVPLQVSLVGGRLVAEAPTLGLRAGPLPIPGLPLLPCASQLTLASGVIQVTCDFTQVPVELSTSR